KLVEIGGKPWGGGPSVDQMVAKAWNMETMTTAVLSSEVEPNPKPGFNHRRSFTYVAAGKHKEPTTDPYALYSAFFGQPSNGGSGQGASDQRLLLRRSVLDHLLGELKSLQMRLGSEEKAKLDIHLTAVRDMEKRLGAGGGQCSNNVK